jgi:hypothetical protein
VIRKGKERFRPPQIAPLGHRSGHGQGDQRSSILCSNGISRIGQPIDLIDDVAHVRDRRMQNGARPRNGVTGCKNRHAFPARPANRVEVHLECDKFVE